MSKELDDGRELRRAVAGLGRRSRTEPIPVAIRAQVVAYARREREEGRSWREVAESVGLAPYTVQRWVKIAEEAEAPYPASSRSCIQIKATQRRTLPSTSRSHSSYGAV